MNLSIRFVTIEVYIYIFEMERDGITIWGKSSSFLKLPRKQQQEYQTN